MSCAGCIARTALADVGSLPSVPAATWKCRVKRVLHAAAGYPLADLRAWETDLAARLTSQAQQLPGSEA